jgi:hypothetical protein
MTTAARTTIATIIATHEAQRFAARQASREVAELDVISVFFVIQAHLKAGRVDEAKAIKAAWKAGQL